ncbi:BUD13 homolog isoform X1 [Frieseomelitta varia]|uniref:BUD13 homolog isoform X1 n=1 Tax=Frieseomelitta varia TaxID=561572 RepID=UPI001CB6B68D|nr:BUD13 homolog isoform X1 [Frieseomelitta varia]
MERKVINQKEYLKKYLSSGDDKKKKKKKKAKLGAKTVKIIDDDIDLKNLRPMEENEFDIFIDAEDAPQIAGVVDERGPVDFTDKRRWKIIANDEDGDLTITSVDRRNEQFEKAKHISDNSPNPLRKEKEYSGDDLSPPRISKMTKNQTNGEAKEDEDSDLSPPRIKSKKHRNLNHIGSDSDSSQDTGVSSHKMKKKTKRKEKISDDSDLSPSRKNKKHKSKKSTEHKNANNSDLSPPRKSRKDSDSDLSPPRKSRKDSDSDLSPPRKSKKNTDSDLNPERNRKSKDYESDLNLARRSKNHKHRTRDNHSERNPPTRKYERDVNVHMNSKYRSRHDESIKIRRNRHDNSFKESSPRYHKYRNEKPGRSRMYKHYEKNPNRRHDSHISPSRKRNRDIHSSSNRHREDNRDFYKSKSNKFGDRYDYDSNHRSRKEDIYVKEKISKHGGVDEVDTEKRMKKTLDGKRAGLQDAKTLREETEAYKKREAEHFSKLSKEVTGIGQAAIVRDTKTGKKRDLEAEAKEEREKQKRQAELDEKYAKWGKGLKQVEDREEKLKDDLYEMSKPLARYADDADLDKRLREQEREGDPMLEYIKQKQIKEGKRKPDQPKYEGSFMPNRFGVKPGHRWDGVDRSNGYEKRWFEAQNAKVARQEEAYKWSTSDM